MSQRGPCVQSLLFLLFIGAAVATAKRAAKSRTKILAAIVEYLLVVGLLMGGLRTSSVLLLFAKTVQVDL